MPAMDPVPCFTEDFGPTSGDTSISNHGAPDDDDDDDAYKNHDGPVILGQRDRQSSIFLLQILQEVVSKHAKVGY